MTTAEDNLGVVGDELDPIQPTGAQLKQFASLLADCDDAIRDCEKPEESFAKVFGEKAAELLGFSKGYVGSIDLTEDTVDIAHLINPEMWREDKDKEALESYVGSGRPTFTTQGKLMRKILSDRKPYITTDYGRDLNVSPKLREAIKLKIVVVSPFVVFREVVGYVLLGYHNYPTREVQWMHERLVAHAAMPIMQSSWAVKFRRKIEIQTKWEFLGQQAGALAHDLKTPLAILGGSLSLIESQIKPDEKNTALLEGAKYQVDRLSSTLANLLSFVKKIDLRIRPIQVRSLIQEAIDGSKPEAAGALLAGNALDRIVHVDRDKITLVLRNIIDNAYESTSYSTPTVEIRADGDKYAVTISILDDGPGIPKSALPKVFEPFYSTKREGNGLGLAVSKRFVNEHGGHIQARNREEGGACFEITLPWRPRRGGTNNDG